MRAAILGAGGHAKVVCEAAAMSGKYVVAGCLDDDPYQNGGMCGNVRILGLIGDWQAHDLDCLVPAIGDNNARRTVVTRLIAEGANIGTAIHPTAIISQSASIGEGTVVMAGAIINAYASVGPDVIVNTGAIVEHDCVVGAHTHLGPGSCLAGQVQVGEGSFIGMGSRVLPGRRVGAWAVVGAGAVLTRDVADGAVVVGVPARAISR